MSITSEEKKAIAALKRVAKKWPNTLWLYSGSGTLWVMKKDDDGKVISDGGGIDPDNAITNIDIENDGGDW